MPKTAPKLRVEREHGGENIEEIVAPTPINDVDCPHETWVLDPTETDFIAYKCSNPNCGIIRLFDK